MNNRMIWIVVVVLLIIGGGYGVIRSGILSGPVSNNQDGRISIVAAEDFYGSVASQIGGDKVSVRNILSDPNVDPHEYESSVQDGIAIADASIVIKNGLQYDAWMDKLLSASPSPERIVITAGDIAPDVLPENPHVWYGIQNIEAVAQNVKDALQKIDPSDAETFEQNLTAFSSSLLQVQAKMDEIKSTYGGTPVGLTETIYLYQTQQMSLDVKTPFNFEKAVAEGNDPSAIDVAATNKQIEDKAIKILIYNSQTVTPITTNLENAAVAKEIPVVSVTETMPSNLTYQTWMMGELSDLEKALAQGIGR